MIFKKFFTPEYLFQNTKKNIDEYVYFISTKNYLFYKPFILTNNNNLLALYSFNKNLINIPENFYKNDFNFKQYTSINKYFDEKTLEFIIKHEVGHLNNHQFLSLDLNKFNGDIFEYINLNSKSNYIKTNTLLDNLFDRNLFPNNSIDDFIHMNFTESYADAYAGITSYLQDKNISIFDKIYQFRLNNLNELKSVYEFNPKVNNSNLEITTGKFAISRYHTYITSNYVKNNIVNIFEVKTLENISFNILHSLLQIEVLHSLKDNLLNEVNNNVLFNNDFKIFLQNKNLSITEFLKEYNEGLKVYKKNTITSLIHEFFFLSQKSYINNLINFHSNNKSFLSFEDNFFNLEQEQSLFLTISRLNSENKLEANRENLIKFIIRELILPKDELLLFINYLSSTNKNNPKFDLIEKSLDSQLLKSLIIYNNNTISSNNIPILNNHTQKKLIEIITQDISSKNKKEFIDYVNKNNITKITTTDLSSSTFNTSNDVTNFKAKSKLDVLNRVVNIKNHNRNNHKNNDTKNFKM